MKLKLTLAVTALMLIGAQTAFAGGDAAAGKAKAAICAACHGANGKAANPMWPSLAGQNEPYLLKQLKDMKSGARSNPMMKPILASLSDTDMANVAAYYASLK